MRYVQACKDGDWHIRVWYKDRPEEWWTVPYSCRSWRHEGECRLWKGAQDFVRVQEAVQAHSDWVYLVLTYAQRQWPSKAKLFRAGVLHWSRLRKRLSRRFGSFRYIQTWEVHKSGYPHCNVLVGNPAFYGEACNDWRRLKTKWLEPALAECGFGKVCWLEPYRDKDGIAGYLCKLANELTGATVKNQVPEDAPSHFRRLRASQGLLKPPHKNPDLTGLLLACPEAFMPNRKRCDHAERRVSKRRQPVLSD